MYCSNCAAPLAPGLSYCNRCGASLKERSTTNTGAIPAFLTAITVIGVVGMAIMLGGAIKLGREAQQSSDIVGIFMLFTFLIVAITEIMLVRQLSRFTKAGEPKAIAAPPAMMPGEFRPAQLRTLSEPVPSVTENTTRTLDHTRNDSFR